MAIYHLHAQIIGRSNGQSAVAAAAYRSTSRLVDRSTGVVCDYTRKSKAIACEILAPKGAPKWARNREELWNSVQEKENRKNSQFAREIDIAIPHELPGNGQAAIRKFCEMFTERGLVCDYALHKPDKNGDNRNLHAHIMVTTRKLNYKGWGEKDRDANSKDFLLDVRKNWEICANAALTELHSGQHIDCRSLSEQGIERDPQQHQGKYATRLERKNQKTRTSAIVIRRGKFAPAQTQNLSVIADIQQIEKIEKDEQLLARKIYLLEMPDNEYVENLAELEKKVVKGQNTALILSIKNHLPEIAYYNKKDIEKNEAQIQELKTRQPEMNEGHGAANFLYTFTAYDGKSYNYKKYREVQQGFIDKWNKECSPIVERGKQIHSERELIDFALKTEPKNAIKELSQLQGIQRTRRPEILEKIEKTQQEFFEKSEYQNLKNIIEEVKAARAETARRERLERQRTRPPQTRGGFSR